MVIPWIYANSIYSDKASQTIFRIAMLESINNSKLGGCEYGPGAFT